jgi:hypothetical protein
MADSKPAVRSTAVSLRRVDQYDTGDKEKRKRREDRMSAISNGGGLGGLFYKNANSLISGLVDRELYFDKLRSGHGLT